MNPKRTSITVTVRNGKNFRATRPGRTFPARGMDLHRVQLAFPGTPHPPYRVTYTLKPRGILKLSDFGQLLKQGLQHFGDSHGTFACFLVGLGWEGLRVSRKVEAIR